MRSVSRIVFCSLLSMVCTLVQAQPGMDSVSASFFRDRYQTTDLGHYLDNGNAYTVYEAETTGEWNAGDRKVFSIAGNSFRQNKYWLNGMRVDSRSQAGNTLLYMQMDRMNLALDYHDGELYFTDDTLQQTAIHLHGNVGNMGGISPGTRQLINLFHKSAEQRVMDDRPVTNRSHVVGAGAIAAAFPVKAYGKAYYQHVYADYGRRSQAVFDHTGISGMRDADYYHAQLDGELPIPANSVLDNLHYFMVTGGRTDAGSEFYFNANEQATERTGQIGLYGAKHFANGGNLTAGLVYELNHTRHDSLSFTRNILDQDGEAFEPWYADGELHSVSLSAQYDQPLLPWLRVHAEGYNSLLYFSPSTREWTNSVFAQSITDTSPQQLYTYSWQSNAFASGILENEALVIAEKRLARGLQMYAHLGVSLDAVLLGGGHSVVTPNWLAKFALDYQPCRWFRIGLSLSHHRMSYTWDEVRYLSRDYMNGEMRYADNTLLATTGGRYHTLDRDLWMHQPSYAVIDLPIRFTFGRSSRHEIAILSSIRKYYNQWFTEYTDGVEANMLSQDGVYYWREGEKQYTVTTQPLDLMSSRWGGRTPYMMSNMVRYTYNGRKWFVQLSWQSYLMAGISTLGSGPLSNTVGALSESTSNPNTFRVMEEGDTPFQANGRLDQDRAYIARIQVTYNACKYFSIGFNGKFKDGQPFVNYETTKRTDADHTQMAVTPYCARGINPANNAFGKRDDAFFNFELHATGRWWINGTPMSLDVLCYNIYDFGTELTEYTFDGYGELRNKRIPMSLCIPRGLLFTLTVHI